MGITLQTPIVGKGGTVADALAFLDRPDDEDRAYVAELHRLCDATGISFAVAFAQFAHETADGTSPRWLTNRNPAGLGIEADDDADPARFTGKEAAQVHVWALLIATGRWHVQGTLTQLPDDFELPMQAQRFYDRWSFKYRDPNCPKVVTVADLGKHYTDRNGEPQATWGWDAQYAEKIAAKANRIFKDLEEETPMPTYSTELPGIPGGPLVTDYPIRVRILPASQTLNRPGTKARLPRRSVQHGNGNGGAFAASDSQWLYNGAPDDDGNPTQTSFHADADHAEVWFNIPGDEVTWQAADSGGPGNMSGFSCEMSEHVVYRNNPTLLRRNIYVNADFMGRIAARLGIAKPERHWDFNYNNPPPQRHRCPNILMDSMIDGRPCWDVYVEQWNASKADELKRMAGGEKPKPTVDWKRGDIGLAKYKGADVLRMVVPVTIKADTTGRFGAGSSSKAFRRLKKGTKAVAIGTFDSKWAVVELADGSQPRVAMMRLKEPLPLPRDAA